MTMGLHWQRWHEPQALVQSGHSPGPHVARTNAIQAQVVAQVAQRSLVAISQHEFLHVQPRQGHTQKACPTAQLQAASACTGATSACQSTMYD